LAGHLDAVRSREARESAHELDMARREIPLVDGVETLDVGVADLFQRRPVVRSRRDLEAVIGGIPDGVGDLGCIPHHFLGHAAHIHAGASQSTALREQHARAVLGRALSAGEAATAAADHDEVVFVCHVHDPSKESKSGSVLAHSTWPPHRARAQG
jgi:hypothetical protein